MKKFVMVIGLVLSLVNPLLCSAYYVIHLRNGTKFITDYYWEKNNQTMFYIYGGLVGVEKNSIKEIVEVNSIYKENIGNERKEIHSEDNANEKQNIFPSDKEKERNTKDTNPLSSTATAKNANINEKIDLEYYRRKMIELKSKLDTSLEKFRNASANKDQEAKGQALRETADISKQISDLSDELKAKNQGVLPDWWEKL